MSAGHRINRPSLWILVLVLLVHIDTSAAVLYDMQGRTTTYCPLKEMPGVRLIDIARNRNYYECPGTLAPEFTECCENNRCCTMSIYKQFDQSILFLVAIFVFSISFVFSIILFFCCFCPPCPLYNSCKTKYTRDYAGCAHKMGEAPLYQTMMPGESPMPGNTMIIPHPMMNERKVANINGNTCTFHPQPSNSVVKLSAYSAYHPDFDGSGYQEEVV